MRIPWLVIALVVLVTPIAASTPQDSLLQEAQQAVKRQLKDPDSAQFRSLVVIPNSLGEQVVCGEYNARNSFGGYVGFKSFVVNASTMSTELDELERSGCLGPEAERSRREKDAKAALILKYRAEAEFNCNVIWTLLENHFRHGQSIDSALDAAMVATANRARENGTDIPPPLLASIRSQYKTVLVSTADDAKAVKSVRRGDGMFKPEFTSSCVLKTVLTITEAAGIQ